MSILGVKNGGENAHFLLAHPSCGGLDLPTFDKQHDTFHLAVLAFGVVVFIQVVAKHKGDALVHICPRVPQECLGEGVTRVVTLAVYEFYEQASLGAAEFSELLAVLFHQPLLYPLQVRLTLALGQELQEFVGFKYGLAHHSRQGVDALYVVHEAVILLLGLFRLVGAGWILVERGESDVRNRVAVIRHRIYAYGNLSCGIHDTTTQQDGDNYVLDETHTGQI